MMARHLRLIERHDRAPRDYVPVVYRQTWRDDVADFINDLRGNPSLALVCAGGGFLLGSGVTVGLAYIIAAVAL